MYWTKENIPLDIVLSNFSSPGAGGQKKNKTNNGVRLFEKNTGIIVQNENTRSLNQNKKLAQEDLLKRLNEHYTKLNREIYNEQFKKSNERIRTYNQKRGTCLDHRTGIQVKIDRINCCPEPEDLDKLINANLLKFKTEVE